MENFDLLEMFLFIFPILQIVLIQLFFKPYLKYRDAFKVSVTDTVIPILLVGIHVLSVRLVAFSLLPYYLFALFAVGLVMALYFEKSTQPFTQGKIVSILAKVAFIIGFIMHYVIVVARFVQLVRG